MSLDVVDVGEIQEGEKYKRREEKRVEMVRIAPSVLMN